MSLSFIVLLPYICSSFSRNVSLTPSNPSQNGVTAIIIAPNNYNNTLQQATTPWNLSTDDNNLYMQLSMNHSWAFDPSKATNISIGINSSNEKPVQHTFIALSFTINNTIYFTAYIYLQYIYIQCIINNTIIDNQSIPDTHSWIFIFTIHNDPISKTSSFIYTNTLTNHTISCISPYSSLPSDNDLHMRINYTSNSTNHSTLNIHSLSIQYHTYTQHSVPMYTTDALYIPSPIETIETIRSLNTANTENCVVPFTIGIFWIVIGGLFLLGISIFVAGYLTAMLIHDFEPNIKNRSVSKSVSSEANFEQISIQMHKKHELSLPQYSHLQSLSYNQYNETHLNMNDSFTIAPAMSYLKTSSSQLHMPDMIGTKSSSLSPQFIVHKMHSCVEDSQCRKDSSIMDVIVDIDVSVPVQEGQHHVVMPYDHAQARTVELLQDAAMIARIMEDEDKEMEYATPIGDDDDDILVYKVTDDDNYGISMDKIRNDVSAAHNDSVVVNSDSDDDAYNITTFKENNADIESKKDLDLPFRSTRTSGYSEGIGYKLSDDTIQSDDRLFSYRSEGIMKRDTNENETALPFHRIYHVPHAYAVPVYGSKRNSKNSRKSSKRKKYSDNAYDNTIEIMKIDEKKADDHDGKEEHDEHVIKSDIDERKEKPKKDEEMKSNVKKKEKKDTETVHANKKEKKERVNDGDKEIGNVKKKEKKERVNDGDKERVNVNKKEKKQRVNIKKKEEEMVNGGDKEKEKLNVKQKETHELSVAEKAKLFTSKMNSNVNVIIKDRKNDKKRIPRKKKKHGKKKKARNKALSRVQRIVMQYDEET